MPCGVIGIFLFILGRLVLLNNNFQVCRRKVAFERPGEKWNVLVWEMFENLRNKSTLFLKESLKIFKMFLKVVK